VGGLAIVISEHDVSEVQRWADGKTPAEFRDQMRVEIERESSGLVVFECRAPWTDEAGAEWTRMPIARLDYAEDRNEWVLYWVDSDDGFHRYDQLDPKNHVTGLLDEIDADPTCIFWG
jgi:hypothetical protein